MHTELARSPCSQSQTPMTQVTFKVPWKAGAARWHVSHHAAHKAAMEDAEQDQHEDCIAESPALEVPPPLPPPLVLSPGARLWWIAW